MGGMGGMGGKGGMSGKASAMGGMDGMGGMGGTGSKESAGVTAVKFGQKSSEHFKTLWGMYVQQAGTGKRDPSEYDEEFIGGFFNYCAARCMGEEVPLQPPAAKRPRVEASGGYGWGSSW